MGIFQLDGQQSSHFEFTDAGNLTVGTKSIKRTSFGKSLMILDAEESVIIIETS